MVEGSEHRHEPEREYLPMKNNMFFKRTERKVRHPAVSVSCVWDQTHCTVYIIMYLVLYYIGERGEACRESFWPSTGPFNWEL